MKINPPFKTPNVAVDTLIFTIREEKLSILLIKINQGPYKGKWALPGGLVPESETLEQTANRILKEKAGIKKIYLEQLYTFSDLDRDVRSRTISVAYFALVNSDKLKLKTKEEFYSAIQWHPLDKLPSLAFDHKKIIQYGYQRLQAKLEYSNIAYALLPPKFTLPELQKVYEIILNKELDKRNFYKKIKALGILTPLPEKVKRGARLAQLYSFRQQRLEIFK